VATVAILVNPSNRAASELAAETARWLSAGGHRVRSLLLDPPDRVREGEHRCRLDQVSLEGVDLAASLGGDGTFLRMIPLAHAAGVPVLGVNFGHLGYLLQVQPSEVHHALAGALAGEAVLEERAVLAVTTDGGQVPVDERNPGTALADGPEGVVRSWLALNEVVVERTYPGHTVRLGTQIDAQPFLHYVADGILVATATGSTAYNLSAGGPVLSPALRSLVVTPIAPHLGFDRSVVLDVDQAVTVTIEGVRPALVVVDGRALARIPPGSAITCRTAASPVRFVSTARPGFGTLLRDTLATERDR